jgi:U4/U6.U5 tri-snRNP-associated protein 2
MATAAPPAKRVRAEDDDSDEEVEADAEMQTLQQKQPRASLVKASRECPYLSTVNREVLDFDFERVCSVTLSPLNVYCCLVDGKYFSGRKAGSPAYIHSVATGRHVFINLETGKVYCLPDNYEVIDPSLDDIKYVLHPTFTPDQIAELDTKHNEIRCMDGSGYVQGIVGINNIGHNDPINCVIHCLSHVSQFRDYFLREDNYRIKAKLATSLVERWGELLRKLWSPKAFRAHVSPHELLQQISLASNKRFVIGKLSDPHDFCTWLLTSLHAALPKKDGRSIVSNCFQGDVEVTTETSKGTQEVNTETTRTTYLHLTLDIPPPPLFRDAIDANALPQVPLSRCLAKFDGVTWTTDPLRANIRRRYTLHSLPRYLIFHLRRFRKNNFFLEKNPTIVNFPIKNLQMGDFLKNKPANQSYKYNLVATVRHEGPPTAGFYSSYVCHKASDKWFEVQDLIVQEVLPQLIVLSEAYLQIYERVDE